LNFTNKYEIECFVVGYIETNMYLITKDKQGIIIDPGFIPDETDVLLEKLSTKCNAILAIFLTHGHFDHISGCGILKEKFKSNIFCHKLELEKLHDPMKSGAGLFSLKETIMPEADKFYNDGDIIDILGIRFNIIHTPGHTKGGVCLLMEDKFLFSGDTIFKASIGRTDLYDGSYDEELFSIKKKILALPPEIIVYPGHGPSTTVANEKKYFMD